MSEEFKYSRESFLKGLGYGTLLLNPLISSVVRAQSNQKPLKFIFFFTANGTVQEKWRPKGSKTPGSLQLSPILQPLEAYKNKVTVIQGLNNITPRPGDSHIRGTLSALTAVKNNVGTVYNKNFSTGYNSGQSLDQFVAEKAGFSSVVAGCQTGSGFFSHVSSRGSNKPETPVDNPYLLHKNIFSSIGRDNKSQDLNYKVQMKKSVFDHVVGDLNRVKKNLPREVASGLVDHIDGIRQLEKSYTFEKTGPGCNPPNLKKINLSSNSSYPTIIDLQIKNVVSAMACGLTNSAVIMCGRGVDKHTHPWVGVNEGHHDLSHKKDSSSKAKLTKIDNWYAQRFNDLLRALDSVSDGGGTLLDNTIVLWGNELSVGATHSRVGIPYVMAGGAGGKLPGGRNMNFKGRNHGELLLSIARAMGHNINSFGMGKKTLSGLFI